MKVSSKVVVATCSMLMEMNTMVNIMKGKNVVVEKSILDK